MEKKNFIILAAALLFLVIAGTTIAIVSHNKKEAEKIEQKEEKRKEEEKKEKEKELGDDALELPDLTGLTVEEAAAKLNKEGISSDYSIKRVDSELKKDVIVKTEPEAGTKFEEKIEITFYLSNGKGSFEIEDYEGKDYKDIKKFLEDRGVTVYVNTKEASYERKDVPADMIIGQSVEAGTQFKNGGTITLYVDSLDLKYPNFTDGSYTAADVEKFCKTYGIKLEKLEDEVTTYEDGKVFYQEGCLPGEAVKTDCEMTIKVAKH